PFAVIDHDGAYPVDAYPLNESIRPFKIFCVLTVILDETADVSNHGILVFDNAKHVSFPDMSAGGASYIDFPLATFNRHRSGVLDHRFRTVSRTAGSCQLQFCGAVYALKIVLDPDRKGGTVP